MKPLLKSTIAILLCVFMLTTTFFTSCDDGLLEDANINKNTSSAPSSTENKSDNENSENEKATESEKVTESDKITELDKEDVTTESILFKTLDFADDYLLECTVPNATTDFDFKNEIIVNEKFNYVVALDEFGMHTVITKKVSLSEGDNKFYIILSEGENYTTFSVTIRRRPMYVVKFNTNGGTSIPDQKIEEGGTITPPTTTKDGYSFAGWDIDLSAPITKDITISASWSGCAYTVTYDANQGTVSTPTKNVIIGESYTLEAPTRTGYSFDGWFYGSQYIPLSGVWSIPENATIKAGWVPNSGISYKVEHYIEMLDGTYKLVDTDNLKGISDRTVTPDTNVYEGFTAPAKQEVKILPNGNQVVRYYYTRNNYNITFITNGGEEIPSQSFKYEESLININEAIRDGYTFGGWFSNINLTKSIAEAMPSNDITIYAYWTEENKPGDFSYSGVNNIIISQYYSSAANVRIPMYIGGVLVTEITSPGFEERDNLISVSIPSGVKKISMYAFAYCTKLMNIFVDDANTVYKSIDGNLYSEDGKILIQYARGKISTSFTVPNSVETIAQYAFESSNILTNIVIPSGVKSIQGYAFSDCSNLLSVTIPNTVEIIGENAFRSCSSLTSIVISNSMTSISDFTFYGCSNLKNITIPSSITSIGKSAFGSCSNLAEIIIPNSVTIINDSAFGFCSSLTSIVIPSSITTINNSTFYWCTGLKNVTIPNSITSIGNSAFRGCKALKNIVIPNSVTAIGNDVFVDCNNLTDIIIPNSVTTIGSSAFSYCNSLTEIVIPESVTSIGIHAFANNNNLTSITFENPNGWTINSVSIPATELADVEIATQYLKTTYREYTWTRN